jgi:outer membrane protein assembly factor BamB
MDPELADAYPGKRAAKVWITLKDGRELYHYAPTRKGDPDAPLSDAELGDKFFEGGTTGTPTLDGGRLYALSRWGDAFCFEAATGKSIWSVNVQKETGSPVPDWGFTGAPLVLDGRLILNVGEAGLALAKATGKLLWKSADKNAGYSTPLPVEIDGRLLVLLGSSKSYLAINPVDAKAKSINTGDTVKLLSARGEVELEANVTDEVKPGILYTTFHFPENMVNNVTGQGCDADTLCPEYKVVAADVARV